jgi:hypothetical protein
MTWAEPANNPARCPSREYPERSHKCSVLLPGVQFEVALIVAYARKGSAPDRVPAPMGRLAT